LSEPLIYLIKMIALAYTVGAFSFSIFERSVNLPFFIARRYLLRQKGAFSAFIIRLAIVATALSVATMVIAVAFVTGFKHEIRGKLFSFWGHVHVTQFTPNTATIITPNPMQRSAALEQKIAATPHVTTITPFALRPVIVNANKLMEGIQLKGVNEQYRFPAGMKLTGNMIDYSDSAYAKQVVLSKTTADRMNLSAGDEIFLYFLEPGSTLPRVRKAQVAGIFHTGMEEVDKNYGICDIRLLQRINNWQPDQVNGYQLSLDDEQYSDSIAAKIYYNYIEPPLTTYTMRDIFPNIFDWLGLQDVNARVIIIIMSIVAIINLAVALLILIVEHSRMVGVLKAQGMASGKMIQVFLYHAGIIAAMGILFGNLLGIGICWLQQETGFLQLSEATYYVKEVPVRLLWWQPVLIDIITLVLCILCMWLPALYIRRIQPAKVLQFK
jgi:lipoprotein-releasing system permease protein